MKNTCNTKNKKNCKDRKVKISKPYVYCGEDLICSGIEKGDSLPTIIRKLNDALCNSATGNTYEFQDSNNCKNGGFIVLENGKEIFEWCQECCGDSVEKELFYEEVVPNSPVVLTDSNYEYYSPLEFLPLIYKNTSGVSKNYKVSVSYNTSSTVMGNNISNWENWVEGAINVIDNSSSIITIGYEDQSVVDLEVNLYNGDNAGDTVTRSTSTTVSDSSGEKVEVRITNAGIPNNVSFFKVLKVDNNESVALQFRTKNDTGVVYRAQMLVEEI